MFFITQVPYATVKKPKGLFVMHPTNPFIKPVEDYNRQFDIVPEYLESHALYLSAMTGDSLEQCLEFVKAQSREGGKFPLNNPKCLIVDKDPQGDRSAKEVTLMGFINRVVKQDLRLSPSLAAYMPETVREAAHSLYIKEGVDNRSKTRKDQLKHESIGTPEAAAIARIRKGQQENYKLNNNSYSGAALSEATVLYNKSTHPSLTSTCRAATSYANANNEKFIMGNRHYYSQEVTIANILSISRLTDLIKLERCMQQFGLHYPTPQEFTDVVHYSSRNYIHDRHFTTKILMLAEGLSPIQRAAVVYVGDLYHLYQYNKDFVKTMLMQLSTLGDPSKPITEAQYNELDPDLKLFTNFVCYKESKGRNHDRIREESPEVFNYIYATAGNIVNTLQEYKLLFEALFLTDNLPSSIYAFPSIYRKAVPVSDTDSTMFTSQYWVEEFFGRITFTPEALRLVFSITFLISEIVMHILAIQSANMGVGKSKLKKLAMKNEYYFGMLSLTNRSKHYYASQDALEGIMFLKSRMEVKGVGLRNSKVPPKINKKAKDLMSDIIDDIKAERQLHLRQMLREIADTEREIIASIQSGSAEYLTTGNCKRLGAYKSEDNATYAKHDWWVEIFSPKYGEIQPPPYTFVKIAVTADNKTRFREWAEGLEDRQLSMRLMKWHMENANKTITNVHIPAEVIENVGIPEPLRDIADIRSVVYATMGVFYLVLESLGIYLIDKDLTKLVSDFY